MTALTRGADGARMPGPPSPDATARHADLLRALAARLRETGSVPPYLLLRQTVTQAIQDGRLRPGDPLPPVRTVAAALGLAPNTVAKAYALLREDGLTENRAGAGTRVRADDHASRAAGPHGGLRDLRRRLQELRDAGVGADELRAVLDEVLEN